MFPYTIALIFFIAVILWQVYSNNESFADTTTYAITDEMLNESITKANLLIARLKTLSDKASGKTFTPIIEPSESTILGKGVSLNTSEEFVKLVNEFKNNTESIINLYKENPTNIPYRNNLYQISSTGSPAYNILSTLENIYNRSAPETKAPETKTADGKNLTFDFDKLWGALSSLTGKKTVDEKAISQDEDEDEDEDEVVVKKTTSSKPAKACPTTQLYDKELETRISKNVVKQVKDGLMQQYQLQGAYDDMTPCAPCDQGFATCGMGQGTNFGQLRPQIQTQETAPVFMKNASVDMNDYIRKDSIPCAKCNLSS